MEALTTDSLTEDWRTAWVPDLGRNLDAAAFLAGGEIGSSPLFQSLRVPKPNGDMTVPVLHPGWHATLHRLVAPVKDEVDALLPESVFGYRRGATNQHYAHSWQRLNAFTEEMAKDSQEVVYADVKGFFSKTPLARAVTALEELVGRRLPELQELADVFASSGLPALPSGYGDARLLGNVVLAAVDRQLSVPFARWVDDYRLFVPRGQSSDAALAELERALTAAGFALAPGKTRTLDADEVADGQTDVITSVYHPERDEAEKAQADLKKAFHEAAEDPVKNRRLLRYVLARMEHTRDKSASEWAGALLPKLPWDAPRLISYLARCGFKGPPGQTLFERDLVEAARQGDTWLVSRWGALALHTGVSAQTRDDLVEVFHHFEGTPAWGFVARILARAGARLEVAAACADPIDARAALIALRDLDVRPYDLAAREPTVAAALEEPAPLPELTSRL